MIEVKIKSHLIITDVHEEYSMKWTGKIKEADPEFVNDKPVFIIVGGKGRTELNTADMNRIEEVAKIMTQPKGREAVTTDVSRIYILEKNGNEKLLGTMTHNHIKQYAPMYDNVGWRD